MLNQVILMGRLVQDPELKHTQTGVSVTRFSIAVDRDYQSRDGGEKKTDFIDIVAWRNTAEFVCKHLFRGRQIVVNGRLQINDWTDRDGGKRRSAEVVADNIYFADSKRDRDGGSTGDGEQYGKYSSAPAIEPDFSEVDDDGELPF